MDNSTSQSEQIKALQLQVEELSTANDRLANELSALRQEAATLRNRDERSREVLDNLPTLISLFSATGSVDVINRRILDYTGKTHEELVQWGMSDLVHPDDLTRAIEANRKGIASGEPWDIVYRMRRHDGVYRWFEAVHRPLTDNQGQITRWCVSVTDIDERKRTEDMLRQQEREAREILDNMPIIVSLLASNGDVQLVSRRTIEYTGKSREELEKWGMNDLIHVDDRLDVIQRFKSGLASNEQHEIVFRMRRHDGVYRWFEATQTPLRDEHGTTVRWCVAVNDIDDRKRVEDVLRENARVSRSIIDGIPGLVATLSREGGVDTVNRQILDYTGSTIEELRDWGTNGIVHPDDMPHVADIFLKAIGTGTPYLIEQRIRRFDGTYRWFDNRGLPIQDTSGTTTGWYVLMADINDRRKVEDALRESEHNLRSFVDGLPGFVATLGRDGAVQSVNRRLLDYVGVPFEELQQWGSNGIVHPDDLAHVGAAFSKSMATGEPYDYEHRLRAADGTYRWFSDRGIPVLDDAGQVTRWYVLIADIDERMRSERALAESERKAQLIVDSIPGGIEVLSPTGSLEAVNLHIRRYLGKTEEDLSRWAIIDAVHPDDRERVLKASAHSIASGQPYDVEHRLLGADGGYRWFHVRGLPLRDDRGQVTRWYALHIDIDERKHAEDALAESERQSRLVVDSIDGMIALFSPDGQLNGGNRQLLDFFQEPLEEVMRWATNGMTHPEDLQHCIDTFMSSIASGEPYDFETRFLRFDGVYRWFQIRGRPLRNSEGRILRWYGLLSDIDDRKRAEQALAESERHARLIVDSIPGLVAVFAPDGELQIVNQQLIEHYGKSFDELKLWQSSLTHPDDLARVAEVFTKSLASGEPFEIENRSLRGDGSYRWLQSKGHPLRDASGQIVNWYNLLVDIDDRKRAEEALRESERQARLIVDSIPGLIVLFTPEGQVEELNEQIMSYLGKPLDVVKEWTVNGILHPDDRATAIAAFSRSLASGEPYAIEARLQRHDGVYHWFDALGLPSRGPDGRILRWYALHIDIDNRKQAEAELDKTRSELAHVTRVTALSTLSASIAHEVSQPLAGIITNASTCMRMLAMEPPDVQGATDTARRTIRDGNRAAEVITRLRALFSNKGTELGRVDLNDAARDVIALSSAELQRNKIELVFDPGHNLPPVTGDRVQLQQVILNLLLNASDALNGVEDRPRQIICRTNQDKDGNVQLSVQDSGVGIDPDAANKLFEAFYTTKDSGMGIGLSVSRSIIERHQGRISASANDGPGASFTLVLPGKPGQNPVAT